MAERNPLLWGKVQGLSTKSRELLLATCSRTLAWESHGQRSLAGYNP